MTGAPLGGDLLRSFLQGLEETGVRCETCGTRYQLDQSPHWAAARRWSLGTVSAWIEAGRNRHLVRAAMDPIGHPERRAELEAATPAFKALGLSVIRLPYNRPHGAPNDRCQVCGADSWTTAHWRMVDDPPRLEAFPN